MLQKIYRHVIQADVVCASGIRVAEASKIVENTQRCVNIALMNEMSRLFSQMDINFSEVLDMAFRRLSSRAGRRTLYSGRSVLSYRRISKVRAGCTLDEIELFGQ